MPLCFANKFPLSRDFLVYAKIRNKKQKPTELRQ